MRNLILSTLSTIALLIYPLSLSAQNSFSVSVDMDSAAGDQAVTSINASADQIVAIQIFATDIQNANGLAVRFEYDAVQVVYEGFDAGDVLPNAQALPEQGTGFVEIGIAALGGQATANSGLVGTVRFRATATFSGTTIQLVRAELSRGGRFETIMPNIRIALQGAPTPTNFSLSLDVDGSAGDQAVTFANVSTDEVVAIQIFGQDIQNANGISIRFEYDANQVVYEGFDAGDALPNAQILIEQGTNPTFIQISLVSFGGQATANSGLVGTIRFRTMEAFSSTAIQLVRAELGRGGQIEALTLSDNAIPIKFTIVLSKAQPVLDMEKTTIDFGTIDAGKTVQQTFTIKNTGTASLEITGIESDLQGLTFEPSIFTLEPEGSRTVTVTFPSSTVGEFSGNINILSNDPDRAKHTLSISGIVQAAPVPVLAVQETAVDFGTVEVAQTVQQTITIKNTGTAPLEITGIESDVSGLTFEPSMFTLAPDGSQTVTVTFPSSTVGEFSGNINILSNDPDRAKHTLSISGIVQAAPVPVLAVQETAVDFGTVEVAQTVQQTITIKNTGTAPLEITGIESDLLGLTFEPSVFTLSPNGSQTVTVTFPSSTVGEFSGNINILSNDPDRAKHTVSVSAIVQAAPAPVLVVGEPAIDFGSIDAEKTVQQTFTIKNTGTAPLEITGIESDLLGLTFEPSMFTLAPDGSQTVTITFPKPMEGEFSGSINILSNDPDRAMHTLSISGIVQPLSVEAKSDFNRDGTIDFADFLLLVSAFGSSESKYDIDGNGAVDFTDFLMFVQVFGKTVNR